MFVMQVLQLDEIKAKLTFFVVTWETNSENYILLMSAEMRWKYWKILYCVYWQ